MNNPGSASATQDAARQVPAYVMGALLIGVGTAHVLVPTQFDWMVPVELPGSQRF